MRQDTDGRAHLAFFDVRTQASFTFNATQGSKINVSIGGYGEPVDHQIDAGEWNVWNGNTGILSIFNNFELVCMEHAATLPNYEDR